MELKDEDFDGLKADMRQIAFDHARDEVLSFASAIAHGDQEHRGWLAEAAQAFNQGKPLPPPRGKGTQEAASPVSSTSSVSHAELLKLVNELTEQSFKRSKEVEKSRQYAVNLARSLHERFYPEAKEWQPARKLYDLLEQIDNMTSGLSRERFRVIPEGDQIAPERDRALAQEYAERFPEAADLRAKLESAHRLLKEQLDTNYEIAKERDSLRDALRAAQIGRRAQEDADAEPEQRLAEFANRYDGLPRQHQDPDKWTTREAMERAHADVTRTFSGPGMSSAGVPEGATPVQGWPDRKKVDGDWFRFMTGELIRISREVEELKADAREVEPNKRWGYPGEDD